MTRKLTWTEDKLIEEAKRFQTKSDFRKESPHAYNKILSMKLGSKAFAHMPARTGVGKWTEDKLIEEILKYEDRNALRKGNQYVFNKAEKLGILNKLGEKYAQMRETPGYWTIDRSLKVAKQYKTRNAFRQARPRAYNVILQNNMADVAFDHMGASRNSLTKEEVAAEALLYDTPTAFRTGSKRHYQAAQRNKWLEEITPHMKRNGRVPRGYWTLERVLEEVKSFDDYTDFVKSKLYQTAQKRGFIDDVKKAFDIV